MIERPVWLEINLAAIQNNICQVRQLVGPQRQIMAIVKANAYGHGAVPVAQAVLASGAQRLGVALMQEAIQLRQAGIIVPILILGWTTPDNYTRAIDQQITLTIFNLADAGNLNMQALAKGKKAQVHLKIDTGMGRLGFQPSEQSVRAIEKIIKMPGLKVEGIFTHLARADESQKAFTIKQLELFKRTVEQIENKIGFTIPIKHAANSAAIIDMPESYFDLVRPGIMIYGLKPSTEVAIEKVNLIPAMSLKARLAQVKKVDPYSPISYGGTFVTTRDSIIGTIPIGYADGYSRLLSNNGEIIINNKEKASIVGRICMDQCMADLTDLSKVPASGDEIILVGSLGENSITLDEIAQKLGTINYEVACMFSNRLPRIYYG